MIAPNLPGSLELMQPAQTDRHRRIGIRRPVHEAVEAHQLRGGKVDGALIRRAVWAEDLLHAYRFLHDALADQGFIEPSPDGLRITCHDAVVEKAVFVVKALPDIIAVQGALTDSEDLGLPSDRAFFPEIDSLRRAGRLLCEATRPEVIVAFQKSILAAELTRCCAAYAISMGCDELVIAVQPWEARGYISMGFQQIGPVRTFSSEVPFPAVLMGLRLDESPGQAARSGHAGNAGLCEGGCPQDRFLHENPYRRYVPQWGVLAEKAFADPAFLREVFVRGGLLARCSDEERETIRGRWKAKLFDRVEAGRPDRSGFESFGAVINISQFLPPTNLARKAV